MMKKTLLSLLIALAVSFSAIGAVTAFAGADDVPEPIALTNVALNKEASFRSFDDMSKTLEWSAYSLFEAPYLIGQEGYSMLSLTDGAAAWGNTQNRAPATANTSAWVFLDLEKEYLAGRVKVMEEEEYIRLLADLLQRIPPDIVIHRLTGDGDKKILVAPMWSADKKQVLNHMREYFTQKKG